MFARGTLNVIGQGLLAIRAPSFDVLLRRTLLEKVEMDWRSRIIVKPRSIFCST